MKICHTCGKRFESGDWRCPNCGACPASRDGIYRFAPELAAANDGFESDAFARLATLEAGNFWFRSRNRLIVWALKEYFAETRKFLEIGCGTGFVLAGVQRAFPGWSLCGSEIHDAGLVFAEGRLPGVTLFQMDARAIPFDAEFDVIGAFDVLEHIDDDETVLKQMRQAVRPGGGILVTVPQHRFLWSTVDDHSCHKRRYGRQELIEKVQRAGFTPVRITSFVSLLLPLMFLKRFSLRGRRPTDPGSELKVGRVWNSLFGMILAGERTLIRGGVSFPAGGSLLLVARRPTGVL